MFKDKYIKDNESIKPSEETLTSLAKKMKEYREDKENFNSIYHSEEESTTKKDKTGLTHKKFSYKSIPYRTVAACLVVLVISIAGFSNIYNLKRDSINHSDLSSEQSTAYDYEVAESAVEETEAETEEEISAPQTSNSMNYGSTDDNVSATPAEGISTEDKSVNTEESMKEDEYFTSGALQSSIEDISNIDSVKFETYSSYINKEENYNSLPLEDSLIKLLETINNAENSNEATYQMIEDESDPIYIIYFQMANGDEKCLELHASGYAGWLNTSQLYKIDSEIINDVIASLKAR